jgi:RNA polymerase sigma-70 factor (ECF subfamily)
MDEFPIWDYRDDLVSLARYLCRNPSDAEDITHNALLKAADGLSGFRGEASVRTWLHRITTNECRALHRRRSASSLDELLDRVVEGEAAPPADDGPVDPEEMLLEIETRRELLDAFEGLPERYRCALLLKDGKGMRMEEMAERLETTVPGVKSLLYRAREELRRQMEQKAGT